MIELFFSCCELFQLLIIYAFADKMLNRKYSQPFTLFGWLVLFVLDAVIVFGVKNDLVNILAYYILMAIILKIFYCPDFQSKIMLVVHIFLYGILSEFVVYIAMSFVGEIKDDMYFLTSALSKIVFSMIVRVATILRKKKNTQPLNAKILFCVFAMPVGTCIGCIVQYFINKGFNNSYLEILFYIIFILVNYFSFAMFDSMQHYVIVSAENQILEKETEYYYKQCEIVQNMWDGLRTFKHDITNQYICEKLMLEKGDYTSLRQQYENMIGTLKYDEIYSKTGNIEIDAIINYKASVMVECGTKVNCDITIPKDLEFDNSDMIVIIGNLLDNALEAVKEVENKKVNIKIKYAKSNLIITISNTYVGKRKLLAEGEYITTKKDESSHGIGLKSVKNVLKKYNGKIFITEDKEIFIVKVHMYV